MLKNQNHRRLGIQWNVEVEGAIIIGVALKEDILSSSVCYRRNLICDMRNASLIGCRGFPPATRSPAATAT
jgi:hypothetical protein